MKFKTVKPFVIEMLTFIFVITGILVGLLAGDFIEISFRIHLITLSFFIIVSAIVLYFFSRIVNVGVRTLLDYILKSIQEDEYIFINIEPYKASVFTEKFDKNGETTLGMYYLIQTKKNSNIHTFLTSHYIEMEEKCVYKIRYGKYSNVVIQVDKVN